MLLAYESMILRWTLNEQTLFYIQRLVIKSSTSKVIFYSKAFFILRRSVVYFISVILADLNQSTDRIVRLRLSILVLDL